MDLEKTFDRTKESAILRKKGITEKLVRVIPSMYDGVTTIV